MTASYVADATQPYQVRTCCGHVVTRRMRPSTAGVAYSPDVVLEAPGGAPCLVCFTAWKAAESAWITEIRRLFGRDFGDALYDARGRGEPGSRLRELHDAYVVARDLATAVRS